MLRKIHPKVNIKYQQKYQQRTIRQRNGKNKVMLQQGAVIYILKTRTIKHHTKGRLDLSSRHESPSVVSEHLDLQRGS